MENKSEKTVEEILHDILKEDRNLLLRREELVERMEPLVAGRFVRNLRPIENALHQNIGEIFLSADGGGREQRLEAIETSKQALLKSGMQEKRVLYVLRTLETALEWDKEPVAHERAEDASPSASVSLTKEKGASAADAGGWERGMVQEESIPLYQESSFREENTWVCSCGTLNRTPTCTWCGKKNPAIKENEAVATLPAQYLRLPPNIWGQATDRRKKRNWGKFLRNATLFALVAIALLSVVRDGRIILPQALERWKTAVEARMGSGEGTEVALSEEALDVKGAEKAFLNFHKAITNKNFREAYSILSSEHHQGNDSYKNFTKAYATTISSVVEGIRIASADSGQAVLSFQLIANDRMEDGRTKIQSFDGTVVMVMEEGRWRIQRSELKKSGERIE